jgi:hypothetical protein
MRMWLVFLILILTPLCAHSQQVLPQSPPLNSEEKRLILQQLYELQAARAQILIYEQFLVREREQDQKEREAADRVVELEKRATALAQGERDLAQEKADLYKQLWEAATKKRGGFGCTMKKIFTLGLARCGG